jgi:hypothetical protein
VGISQDVIIFGFLALAFIMYITLMGELQTYLGFFIPPPAAPASSPASPSAAPGDTSGGVTNPGIFGGDNPVGALTANPATGFGFFPMLEGIKKNLGSVFTGGGKVVQ